MSGDQYTFDSRPTRLDQIAAPEPTDDSGVRQVLVSSSSSGTRYHKQDAHDEGSPACGQKLSAEHTSWRTKPKGAMQRSSSEPCPDCYPGGDESA